MEWDSPWTSALSPTHSQLTAVWHTQPLSHTRTHDITHVHTHTHTHTHAHTHTHTHTHWTHLCQWYQCYHCWCCTLMISCISMRAAAITPGSGSLREALNSACRWETVVGEMSWKWCIANSAFLRTSSLCEQWSWYYHHWSAKIANYQYWSPLVNVNWSLILFLFNW